MFIQCMYRSQHAPAPEVYGTPIRAPANPSFERPTPTPVNMSGGGVLRVWGTCVATSTRFRAASVGFQRAFSGVRLIFVCAGKETCRELFRDAPHRFTPLATRAARVSAVVSARRPANNRLSSVRGQHAP